jgi:hypothetical protein
MSDLVSNTEALSEQQEKLAYLKIQKFSEVAKTVLSPNNRYSYVNDHNDVCSADAACPSHGTSQRLYPSFFLFTHPCLTLFVLDSNNLSSSFSYFISLGLVHYLPFEPLFCTRHLNMIARDVNKREDLETKLGWVAELAERAQVPQQLPLAINNGPAVESTITSDSDNMSIDSQDQGTHQ